MALKKLNERSWIQKPCPTSSSVSPFAFQNLRWLKPPCLYCHDGFPIYLDPIFIKRGFKPVRKGEEREAPWGLCLLCWSPPPPLPAHSHTGCSSWPITLPQTGLVRCGGLGRRVQVLLVAAAALLSGSIKGNYCWW